MDFAVRFGSPASPALRKAILAAHKLGGNANDLSMMLLSGDIRWAGTRVVVKQGSWTGLTLAMPNGVFLLSLTVVSLISVAACPLTFWEKAASVALLAPIHACLWRLWFIVDVRIPLARLRASRVVSAAIADSKPASIFAMPPLR